MSGSMGSSHSSIESFTTTAVMYLYMKEKGGWGGGMNQSISVVTDENNSSTRTKHTIKKKKSHPPQKNARPLYVLGDGFGDAGGRPQPEALEARFLVDGPQRLARRLVGRAV